MPTEAGSTDAVVLDPDAITGGHDALGVGAGDAPPGTYVLVFRVDTPATIDVGALGAVEFPSGAYAYVGSAFGGTGSGASTATAGWPRAPTTCGTGTSTTSGATPPRRWLPSSPRRTPTSSAGYSSVCNWLHIRSHAVVRSSERRLANATIATELRETVDATGPGDTAAPAPAFGASDCGCPAHLVAGRDPDTLRGAAVDAVDAVTSTRA